MLKAKVQSGSTDQTVLVLEKAFERFNEASHKLEAKYQILVEESNDLREKLRQKDLEIQRHERLATLGKTAAALAHEVRNPLGAIKLFLSLLRQDLHDRPQSLEVLDQMNVSVSTLDSVVSNILQFSKDKPACFNPLNLHAIINEQIALIRSLGSEGLDIVTDLKATPFIVGDEHGLRRVFYNLFVNSWQAVAGNGQLRVTTRDDNESVLITIADDGPGVPEALLDSIFDPFVTTKNAGTGLGLAVVRQIVDQHGGRIQVVNRQGAEFEVRLERKSKGASSDGEFRRAG